MILNKNKCVRFVNLDLKDVNMCTWVKYKYRLQKLNIKTKYIKLFMLNTNESRLKSFFIVVNFKTYIRKYS